MSEERVDIFSMEMPVIEIAPFNYRARLDTCDPTALEEQRGSIFPEAPLERLPTGINPETNLEKALRL